VGVAYPVELHPDSPLRQEGVHHVIHVLGPNMSPNRPNCLGNNYSLGEQQLAQCYRALFACFLSIAKGESAKPRVAAAVPAQPSPAPTPVKLTESALDLLMSSSRKQSKAAAVPAPAAKAAPAKGGWSAALFRYVDAPESCGDAVVCFDKEIVVVHDKFPKARYHFLVLPRQHIPTFAQLSTRHLPLLRKMYDKGQSIIAEKQSRSGLHFRCGFHALPSMKQVHMHVISQDFDSPSMKKKVHWNSFTTEFFIDALAFIGQLNSKGRIEFDKARYSEFVKQPLRCHRCGEEQRNMPALKRHIANCQE